MIEIIPSDSGWLGKERIIRHTRERPEMVGWRHGTRMLGSETLIIAAQRAGGIHNWYTKQDTAHRRHTTVATCFKVILC